MSCLYKDETVNPAGLHPRLIAAAIEFHEILQQVAGEDLIFTSINDGRHGQDSLHPYGLAWDARSHHLTDEEANEVLRRARERLGDHYDILLEDEGLDNEHFHVEWDPQKDDDVETTRWSYVRQLQDKYLQKLRSLQ